jgi:hypothetical protein
MDPNYGIIIGLILTVSGVAVVGLSDFGVYLMGHSRGRHEAELEQRALDREMGPAFTDDRVAAIEGALSTMAQAIERLSDAQRIALLDRVRSMSDSPPPARRLAKHDTPA